MRYTSVPFNTLLGLTLVSAKADGSSIIFVTDKKAIYRLEHTQDCCESVYIESIVGDLNDLTSMPILTAEEAKSGDEPPPEDAPTHGSHTWTFYKLATIKGYVDIRFFGTSNGYYSETAELWQIKGAEA